jgi:hypothetical protein
LQSTDGSYNDQYHPQTLHFGPALGALVDLSHMSLAKNYEVHSYREYNQDIEKEEYLAFPASNRGEEMTCALELGAAKLALVLRWY